MNLKTEKLFFSYNKSEPVKWTLQDINLSISSENCFGIAGPNGSGKSTFLKLISGLLPNAYEGEILWNEQNIKNLSRIELSKKVSYAPGYFQYSHSATVFDFVLQSRFAKHSFFANYKKEDFDIVEYWLQKLDLINLRNASIENISTGQLQLALIARAFAQDAHTIILDEALANLDFRYQAKVFELLLELNNRGKLVFIVSHDLNLLSEFCPSLLWFSQGRVVVQGKTKEVLNQANLDKIYETQGILKILNSNTDSPKVLAEK